MEYPFLDFPDISEQKEIPVASEYDYDIDKAQFKFINGKMRKVYKNEALKIKIWKLFMTEKYREVVFPWTYGHELLTLIGKSYTQGYINSEAERYIKEAIFKNLGDYVTELENMQIYFSDGTLFADFTAVTIYGRFQIFGLKVGER